MLERRELMTLSKMADLQSIICNSSPISTVSLVLSPPACLVQKCEVISSTAMSPSSMDIGLWHVYTYLWRKVGLVSRPFFCGGGKMAWCNLLAHAQDISADKSSVCTMQCI